MSARGLRPIIAVLGAALFVWAQKPVQAQKGSVDELAGLWKAQRWFGPVARGPLLIKRTGSSYAADMVGRTIPIRVERGELSFELPNNQGKFRGKLQSSGTIFGFWFPNNSPTGMVRVLPVTLRAVSTSLWSGEVNPPDDTFTFYLLARKRPDGSMGVFLRNPDRDQGALWAVDRIVRDGNSVKLISKRSGGNESDLATGTYDLPFWSPDGSLIAFTRKHEGNNFDIYAIRPDGSDLRQLTTTPANDAHAVWTEDSKYLMWNSGMYGFKDEAALYDNTFQPYGAIFIMKADGTDKRQLTDSPWEDGMPRFVSSQETKTARDSQEPKRKHR